MFGEISFKYKLWRLETTRARILRGYRSQRQALRGDKDRSAKRDELNKNEQIDIDELDDDINTLITNHLLTMARRHQIALPDHDDEEKWQESYVTGAPVLTERGISDLRTAIRTERKERSELLRAWLTPLTGLVGALIGLAAIVLGHK